MSGSTSTGLDLEERNLRFLVCAGGGRAKRNLATLAGAPAVKELGYKRIGSEVVATAFQIMHRISRGRESSEGG